MLDFVKAERLQRKYIRSVITNRPLKPSGLTASTFLLVIVYFVSLSCLSNPFLMRICSWTLSSGPPSFLLTASEAVRER